MPEFRLAGRRAARALGCSVLAAIAMASSLEAQTERTMTSSRQLWDDSPLAVEVEYGAGTLEVRPVEDDDLLYHMEVRYDEQHVAPVAEFDSAARVLRLGARRTSRGGHEVGASDVEIALSTRAPLDLGLHFGAGEAEMELGGLRIRKLLLETGASETSVRVGSPNPIAAELVELKAGAAELRVSGLGNLRADRIVFQGGVGSTTLDFGGAWNRNATAHVQMGIGEVILRLPRNLGVKIDRTSFLTSFEADGFQRGEGGYFSRNWSSAGHQLTIDLEAALGAVRVEWIDD